MGETGVTRLYHHNNVTCHQVDIYPGVAPRVLQVLRIG
jgi:hypothetical protein